MDWLTLIVIPLVIGVAGLIIEYWFIIPAREEKERRKKHEDRSIATNPQFTMPAITDSDPVEYVFDAIRESVQLNHPTSGSSHASSTASGSRAARTELTTGMDKHFRFP